MLKLCGSRTVLRGFFRFGLHLGDEPLKSQPIQGRLAQLVERFVYTEDVGSSSLSSPTIPHPRHLEHRMRCNWHPLSALLSGIVPAGDIGRPHQTVPFAFKD